MIICNSKFKQFAFLTKIQSLYTFISCVTETKFNTLLTCYVFLSCVKVLYIHTKSKFHERPSSV